MTLARRRVDTSVSKYIKALEQVPILPSTLKNPNETVVKLLKQVRQVLSGGHEDLQEQLDRLDQHFSKEEINGKADPGVRKIIEGLSRVRFWTVVVAQDAHPTVAREAQRRQLEIKQELVCCVQSFLKARQPLDVSCGEQDEIKCKVKAPVPSDTPCPQSPPSPSSSIASSNASSPRTPITPSPRGRTFLQVVSPPSSCSPATKVARKRKLANSPQSSTDKKWLHPTSPLIKASINASQDSQASKDSKESHSQLHAHLHESLSHISPASSTSSVAMWMPTALLQGHPHLNSDGELPLSKPPALPAVHTHRPSTPAGWVAAPKPDLHNPNSQPATPHPLSASIERHPITPTASLRYSSSLFQFNEAFEDESNRPVPSPSTTPPAAPSSPRQSTPSSNPFHDPSHQTNLLATMSSPRTPRTDPSASPPYTHRHTRTNSDLVFFQNTSPLLARTPLDTDHICLALLSAPAAPNSLDASMDPFRDSIFRDSGFNTNFTPSLNPFTNPPLPTQTPVLPSTPRDPTTDSAMLRASHDISVEFPNHKTYVNALSFQKSPPKQPPLSLSALPSQPNSGSSSGLPSPDTPTRAPTLAPQPSDSSNPLHSQDFSAGTATTTSSSSSNPFAMALGLSSPRTEEIASILPRSFTKSTSPGSSLDTATPRDTTPLATPRDVVLALSARPSPRPGMGKPPRGRDGSRPLTPTKRPAPSPTPEPSDWSISSHTGKRRNEDDDSVRAVRGRMTPPDRSFSTGVMNESNAALSDLKRSIAGSLAGATIKELREENLLGTLPEGEGKLQNSKAPPVQKLLKLFSRLFTCKRENPELARVDGGVASEQDMAASDGSSLVAQDGTKDEAAMRRLYSLDYYSDNTPNPSPPVSRAPSFIASARSTPRATQNLQVPLLENTPSSSPLPSPRRFTAPRSPKPSPPPGSLAQPDASPVVRRHRASSRTTPQTSPSPSPRPDVNKCGKRTRWWEEGSENLVVASISSQAGTAGKQGAGGRPGSAGACRDSQEQQGLSPRKALKGFAVQDMGQPLTVGV